MHATLGAAGVDYHLVPTDQALDATLLELLVARSGFRLPASGGRKKVAR